MLVELRDELLALGVGCSDPGRCGTGPGALCAGAGWLSPGGVLCSNGSSLIAATVENCAARGRGTSVRSLDSLAVDQLVVSGAREHNLKDVTVAIPRGIADRHHRASGSGKSSLAFDTIYAEGQRRYVESLSAYARQFLGQMDKPDVD